MSHYQPDTLMKDYWRNSERFKDLCNGLLFQSQSVIDDIRELDSEQGTTVQKESIQRRRDLLKITKIKGKDVIIGIENQQEKDATMPFRDLEYTSLKYSIRLKDSTNKICPIITIVMYYGSYQWNKKTKLRDLMDVPEEIEDYYNNWKTLVIDAKKVDVQMFKNKEVRDFFEGLQNLYSWDKDISNLKELQLSYDCAIAIGVVTGTQALIDKAEKEKGGMINMCEAVTEAIKDGEKRGEKIGEKIGEKRGEKIGEIRGRTKGNIEAIQKMMKKLYISEDEAMDILDIPLSERNMYKKAIVS